MHNNGKLHGIVTLVDLTGRYRVAGGTLRRWIAAGAFPQPARRVGACDVWEWDAVEQAELEALAGGKRAGLGRAASLAREAAV
jgi:hypothetical protein